MTDKQRLADKKHSEKIFSRMMRTILEFSIGKERNSPELQAKIQELNQKWIEHCKRTPTMLPAGQLEFMRVLNLELDKIYPLIINK